MTGAYRDYQTQRKSMFNISRYPLSNSNRTIGHFISLRKEDVLVLSPPYQRGDVWGRKRRVNLIRSLLSGIPIPSVVINYRDWLYHVVDGKQRISTILMFLDGEFGIPSEWVREGCLGEELRYPEFNLPEQRFFRQLPISVSEGQFKSEEDEIFLFNLINFGGLSQGEVDEDI